MSSLTAAEYLADPCPEPSLSASIAKILCESSPLHAWTAHPRLNPDYAREEKEHLDLGTIAHAIILQGESVAEVLDFENWRTNAAKDARDNARKAGKLPILKHDMAEVELMVKAFHIQADAVRPALFGDGVAEESIQWQEDNGIWCRARLDWRSANWKRIVDYKTTGGTANPEIVTRTLYDFGYDIQEAFYRRGVERVHGVEATFRFAYQETKPPFALSVVACDPHTQMLADKKVRWAIEKFGECLQSECWPGYPAETCYAMLPEWREKIWLDKEMKDNELRTTARS